MDEFKILFWIILGLIWIFSRSKKKQAPPRNESSGPTVEPPKKPVTFEELLREIQEMKKPAEPEPPARPLAQKPYQPAPTPAYVDYDDNIGEEEKDIEDKDFDYKQQDKIYEVYESAKREAFHRKSLEETTKLEDTIVEFGTFKGYDIVEQVDHGAMYRKELQNPQDFKRAFILSEILKRKF